MLILAIILIVFGFCLFQWVAFSMGEPIYNRPLIFSKTVPTLIINFLWVSFLGSGLYCLWKVNYAIVLILIAGFISLLIVGYFLGTDKSRAKKIFSIYKKLKLYRFHSKEEDILKEVTKIYFSQLKWVESRIDSTMKYIFADGKEITDVKDLVSSIFIFETPNSGLENYSNFIKKLKKKERAIKQAYREIFGEDTVAKGRPVLSQDALQRLKNSGLNPDEMSNEQLSAFESMENVEKFHWVVKIFNYGAICFALSAIISLFTANLGALVLSVVTALVLMYIGYRIQSKIAGRKFFEASIDRKSVV